MESIKIHNLHVRYGEKTIIKNFSMPIKKNKITAIIGPSGCGKSTLLMTLNRILEDNGGNYKGEILFNGKDILSYKKDNLRKNIGIVFQKPSPFPFSIYKNLSYAPIFYGVKDRKKLDKLVEVKLREVGLWDEIDEDLNMLAKKLSGGQQQRLCIARALTVGPDVLLLDEPCSALDIKNIQKIEEMLLRISKKHTIVIVTHNLAQAKRISDYTAFMMDGKLIEYGETERIFTNPIDKRTEEYIEGVYG